jgi:hypothetical protein
MLGDTVVISLRCLLTDDAMRAIPIRKTGEGSGIVSRINWLTPGACPDVKRIFETVYSGNFLISEAHREDIHAFRCCENSAAGVDRLERVVVENYFEKGSRCFVSGIVKSIDRSALLFASGVRFCGEKREGRESALGFYG